jgi:TolA-binding protein
MPFPEIELADSAEFARTPLPRVLIALHRAKYNGSLVLHNGRQQRRFIFQAGSPVLSESNLASDSLAAHLREQRLISAEGYPPVLDYARKREVSEGEALLALRILKPVQLFHALREQIRDRLVDSMRWQKGRYELAPTGEKNLDIEPLGWDLPPLIHRALADHWTVDRLLNSLSPRLLLYPRMGPGFAPAVQRLELSPDHRSHMAALHETRSVSESLGAGLTATPVLAALWVLDSLGTLDFAEAPPERRQDEVLTEFDAEIELALVDGDGSEKVDEVPANEAPSQLCTETETLRLKIQTLRAGLGTLDHYQLLDVSPKLKSAAIKKAYIEAAKRYHPDVLARLGLQDIKTEASEVFSQLTQAFDVLSNPEMREAYDAEQRGELSGSDAQILAQAETTYRKGEILLRMGDFGGALRYLESAVKIWPDEGVYRSALGWALYKQPCPDPKAAREHLTSAVELSPGDPVAHFRLGMVLRALGESQTAQNLLDRAKQLEPQSD